MVAAQHYGLKLEEKIRASFKDLRDLRATFHLAQEVGEGLGRSKILLGQMPRLEK
jgi:hypothetical protein